MWIVRIMVNLLDDSQSFIVAIDQAEEPGRFGKPVDTNKNP